MEAKYLNLFRKFHSLSWGELRKIASTIGISYQNKDKRKLAKDLAVFFYNQEVKNGL